ncbi:MAG: TetR/AcrR family transcriptional regulator [Planctomycetes bacterium]|nr:TetR/AcrR family transcriptional regulator [Planctomycetota bacterium]
MSARKSGAGAAGPAASPAGDARSSRTSGGGRANQRLRTRKELLAAAARLMREGEHAPTLEDVAKEALVSRATAYRYFPSIEALLVEAPLDAEVPAADALFADVTTLDPAERVDLAEAALHAMCYANQAQLRALLAESLKAEPGTRDDDRPLRQNRRLALIEAALAPTRGRFDDETYERLCAALSLVFGLESMIVFSDVHPLEPDAARAVKSWTARALVRAALDDASEARR